MTFKFKTVQAFLLPALQKLASSSHSNIDKFQTVQGLSLFFQNNSTISEIHGLFEDGLEIQAGAGTLTTLSENTTALKAIL